jgi:hypothetical protein
MSATIPNDSSRRWWPKSPRQPVDDVYVAWFNANSRCSQALRAWREAGRAARSDAYHAYQAALDIEEAAAAELALHAIPRAA